MVEQTDIPEWILEENAKLESIEQKERLPVLKFEERKVTTFKVDFSKKFDEFPNKFKEGETKVVIPVEQGGNKKVLFLNKRNPLLYQLYRKAKQGINEFKVIQIGIGEKTKYELLEDK
jgi:hypothetical protein